MSKNNLIVNKETKTMEMSREFNASRELLWKAHTDPKFITQWWGPRKNETIVEKMDVRPGGEWRFLNTTTSGEKYAFYGIYKAIKKPEYITWTFNYEPIGPGHEITETVTFIQIDAERTRVVTSSHYTSSEDLEGMLQSGMEEGAIETWDRLEELVEKK